MRHPGHRSFGYFSFDCMDEVGGVMRKQLLRRRKEKYLGCRDETQL